MGDLWGKLGQNGRIWGYCGANWGFLGAFCGIADNQQVARWLPKGYRKVAVWVVSGWIIENWKK